jgi:uncharacterized protein (TIGR01777 family)
MNVLLTGATGFLGSALVNALLRRGDTCRALARDAAAARSRLPADVPAYDWAPLESTAPAAALDGVDAVVNLAGEPVNGRWSKRKREAIRASRVVGTRNLVAGMKALGDRPAQLVSVSAVGYYGDRGDEVLDEAAPAGSGFLASVCVEWERAARGAEELGIATAVARLGIVLGRAGGALPPLLRAARLGLGGPLAGGRQWWPWVHVDDVVSALLRLLDGGRGGVVNVTAPSPARQRELAAALGRVLRRPAAVPAPELALRLALGGFEAELLASRRAVPRRLLQHEFTFRFAELEPALRELTA